jgi:hypothetical protein
MSAGFSFLSSWYSFFALSVSSGRADCLLCGNTGRGLDCWAKEAEVSAQMNRITIKEMVLFINLSPGSQVAPIRLVAGKRLIKYS